MHIEDLCEALNYYQRGLRIAATAPTAEMRDTTIGLAEAILLHRLEAAGLAGLIDFTPRKD